MKTIIIILFALFSIVEQPDGKTEWVSSQKGTVTHWVPMDFLKDYALMAHSNLDGRFFFLVKPGDLLWADGKQYVITETLTIKTTEDWLEPLRPCCKFILMTCTDGISARYFVVGKPTGLVDSEFNGLLALPRHASWLPLVR